MKLQISPFSLLLLGSILLNGCMSAPQTRSRNKTPKAEEIVFPHTSIDKAGPQELRDYNEIEALFTKNASEALYEKFIINFTKKHRHSSLLPSVENIHGLFLLRNKKPKEAAVHFKRAIELNPSNQIFNQFILFNLATAQFDSNEIDESQQTLNKINLDSLDKPNRVKVYLLKANIYEKKSFPLESARQLLSAGRFLSEVDFKENRKPLNKLLDQTLQNINDTSLLEKLYLEYEDSPLVDALLFRLGSQEITLGNRGNGEVRLGTLISKYPQSAYYAQAAEMLKHSQDHAAVKNNAVGILLPMKGKFSKFGTKSLQGIQLAFGIFNSKEPDSKIELYAEDSGEEPEQAIRALNRLVFKHHVVAVIGPMLSKGVEQIAQRAQELGVPLISLSRRSTSIQDYIFQAGLTQQLQAVELARHAIQKMGIKNFGIIYPNDKIGIESSQSFWDGVESQGGNIVGIETYRPGETDFRQPIDKISGLYYLEARRRELDMLAREREANGITKRTRKTEQFFNLKPIVDYGAVFISDEPRVAGQILPTFAYRDVENIKFLGTSSWNSPDFLERAQNYGEKATFVDAFFSESTSPKVRKFIENYKKTFGQDATSLEALAYDAGALVQDILTSSKRLSRADMRDKLKETRGFQGVTGKMTFKDGQFFRDLRILTIRNGHIIEADTLRSR